MYVTRDQHPVKTARIKRCDTRSKPTKIKSKALSKLIKISNGSPRQALVTLNKIVGLSEKEMISAIISVDEDNKEIIDLCRALIKGGKWLGISKILKGLQNKEPEDVRRAVLGYCNTVLLKEDHQRAFLVMDSFREPFYNTGKAG